MPAPYKLIYNPHAGDKAHPFSNNESMTLDILESLVRQYDIEADFFPTKHPKHATELARQSIKEGYKAVLVAGGDGTVGEAANGLINTDMPLGILPFGTFMNVAQMLSIPTDLAQATLLIKVGKTRKIDVGCVSRLEGEKLLEPYYFIESAGVGWDAKIQKSLLSWERQDYATAWEALTTSLFMYNHPITLLLDDKKVVARARLITIANGPMMGANLKMAPTAKLNDHSLTVSIFHMTRLQLLTHLWYMMLGKKHQSKNIQTFNVTHASISSDDDRPVHVDARLFGTLPAEFKILPEALTMIVGFPENKSESALKEKTVEKIYLEA